MFGFLRRGGMSEEERVDALEYLRETKPLFETLNREFRSWLREASDGKRVSLDHDPDGQHAAVYLYRVDSVATEFVQTQPVKAARAFYEHFALCLEARAAAAEAYKEGANYATRRDPAPRIALANRKLAEAERELELATAALRDLEAQIARR